MAAHSGRIRVVYDCMIFLQGAARKESPAGLCLSLAEVGAVELCLSDAILREVGEVLRRPGLRARFPALNEEMVTEFLHAVREFSTLFAGIAEELRFARDPKDQPYLNLARMANARFLVSRDADLLIIATSSDSDSVRIRKACPDLAIVNPVYFLKSIARSMELSF